MGAFFEDGYLVPGNGFGVRPSVWRCRVPGFGYRTPGTWDPVPSTESTPRAGHRDPSLGPDT
jgi:hypothetical protein